jgi:dCMP deaminase
MKLEDYPMYMEMSFSVSKRSRCERKQVGCLIVKDNNIISYGWNGTPTGMDNCCEDEHGNTKANVLHAEQNALMKLAKTTGNCEGASMFVTLSPCSTCAILIKQAGINEVFYYEEYRDPSGIDALINMGISVTKLEKEHHGKNSLKGSSE